MKRLAPLLDPSVFQILLIAALVGVGVYALRAHTAAMPIVIETAHVPELRPHEHDAGDSAADKGHHVTLASDTVVAPRDLYVTAVGFKLVNAPNWSLHHASLLDTSHDNETCPQIKNWKELFVYGSDRLYDDELRFPEGYAMRIPKGTPLKLILMLHNPEPPLGTGETFHDVYTRMTLTESTADPKSLTLIDPYLLHLDDPDITCWYKESDFSDFYTFTVPPKTKRYVFSGHGATDKAASVVFTQPGTLLDLSGHLHGWQGGKELIVKKNGAELYTFVTARAPGEQFRYDTKHTTTPFHVDAGDRVSVTAVYENDAAVPVRGAMGIAGWWFAPDSQ